MHHYELVVVLSPMLNQEQAAETWGRIKEFVANRNGEITHEERWGTRRLAYAIRKGAHNFLEGSYHLTRFTTERPFIRELENFLRVDEQVLRSLVVATPPSKAAPAVVAEEAPAVAEPEAAVTTPTRPVAEVVSTATEAPVAAAPPVVEETVTRSPRRQPGRQQPPEETTEVTAEPVTAPTDIESEPVAEEAATTPRRRQPSRRRTTEEATETVAEPVVEATATPTEPVVADTNKPEQPEE